MTFFIFTPKPWKHRRINRDTKGNKTHHWKPCGTQKKHRIKEKDKKRKHRCVAVLWLVGWLVGWCCCVLCVVWEFVGASFRHSAGLHVRVILDGATCRLSDLGGVRDVLSVLVVW